MAFTNSSETPLRPLKSPEEKRAEQMTREEDDVEASIKTFRERVDLHPAHSQVGVSNVREMFAYLEAIFQKRQEDERSPKKFSDIGYFLLAIDPASFAVIFMREVLFSFSMKESLPEHPGEFPTLWAVKTRMKGNKITSNEEYNQRKAADLSRRIGERCNQHWKSLSPKTKETKIAEILSCYISPRESRQGKAIREKLDGDWDLELKILLGRELMNGAVKKGFLAIKQSYQGRGKRPNVLSLNDEFFVSLEWDKEIFADLAKAVYRPMVCEPVDWSSLKRGGYLKNEGESISLVRHWGNVTICKGLLEQESQLDRVFSAVNALQKTPWQINQNVYETIRSFEGVSEERLFPTFGMSTSERKARRTLHSSRLSACEDLLSQDRFYFPYYLDYRGRTYCTPQIINYQLDDMVRSLLVFADAKPLGKTGIKWLKIHLANCWGHGEDKKSFIERQKWVDENLHNICESVDNPVDNRWWVEANKPWRFLAACFEMKRVSETGVGTLSHLPIGVDGTCNGFQHISALLRDRNVARLTNLISIDTPGDLYAEVAKRLTEVIQVEARRGVAIALEGIRVTEGSFNRDFVKKAVMATPYGISDDQIRVDMMLRLRLNMGIKSNWDTVAYLCEKLLGCIRELTNSDKLTNWFKGCVDKLVDKNLHIEWITPSGFRVVQAKYMEKSKALGQVKPKMIIYKTKKPLQIDRAEQKNGIMPNFIHSLDASHLALTINNLAGKGLSHFGVVHDGYAVHGCDIDILNQALREEFVGMYRRLDLREFPNIDNFSAKSVTLPTPPLSDDRFDIDEVLKSEYFFS